MKNFKLNEKDILSNQDWTFPTTTYYGPGRFNEIAKFCEEFDIKNPLIVTDSGSKDLPFIKKLIALLSKNNIKSDLFIIYRLTHEMMRYQKDVTSLKMEVTTQS